MRVLKPGSLHEDELCRVAPHPELAARMREELAKLQGTASPLMRSRLALKRTPRVGLDDGLIVPGNLLPLGSPPEVARNVAADRAPLRGDVRAIVVLVDFPDAPMAQNRQHFQDLFFSTGVVGTGSVREFYTEASHGLVTLTGEVVGPFRMPHPVTYYANGDSGMGAASPNARDMARDAAVAANPTVDFGQYDNDGNGFVDAFVVVHAGPGAEVTGDVNQIWSHKWVLSGNPYDADGTKIYAYLTVPEDSRTGVCAHELGHLLFGWPDLYDTDYSSEGIGNWCLMAGGSWNGGGNTPAHPSAWCKANQGWVSIVSPTTNQQTSIADVKSGFQVYRLWKDGAQGSEYFLLENRQRTQFDAQLPGDGLLIFHVDETIASNSDENHPKIALLQADGHRDLEHNANRGDAGDTYPGSSGNTTLNSASNPSSKSYGNAVSVTQIGASGATMSARIAVKCVTKKREKLEKLEKTEKIEKHEKAEKLEKEFIKERKEIFEKTHLDKRPEKPLIDKSSAFDKNVATEKPFDKPADHGGFGEGAAGASDLAARVSALEEAVGRLHPFIDSSLRPDLSKGALSEEGDADAEAVRAEMLQGTVHAKRHWDKTYSR
jgi:immune inhibitor A